MRIVALEEHVTIPSLVATIPKELILQRGFPPPDKQPNATRAVAEKLKEFGDPRIADMDAAGVTVQVLSISGPGADLLPPDEGAAWATQANDVLADAVRKYPGSLRRLRPSADDSAPQAAATELERCVRNRSVLSARLINGLTQDKFLDDPMFEPLLAKAESARRSDLSASQHSAGVGPKSVLRRAARADGLHPVDRRLWLARGDGDSCFAIDSQRHA